MQCRKGYSVSETASESVCKLEKYQENRFQKDEISVKISKGKSTYSLAIQQRPQRPKQHK